MATQKLSSVVASSRGSSLLNEWRSGNSFLLNQIGSLHELKGPGFSLEALKGDREGQHSIRINEKWRICFTWIDHDAYRVEITDYH